MLQRVLVTEYGGMIRNGRVVYSFEKWGNVWFCKRRHGGWFQIDEVK